MLYLCSMLDGKDLLWKWINQRIVLLYGKKENPCTLQALAISLGTTKCRFDQCRLLQSEIPETPTWWNVFSSFQLTSGEQHLTITFHVVGRNGIVGMFGSPFHTPSSLYCFSESNQWSVAPLWLKTVWITLSRNSIFPVLGAFWQHILCLYWSHSFVLLYELKHDFARCI